MNKKGLLFPCRWHRETAAQVDSTDGAALTAARHLGDVIPADPTLEVIVGPVSNTMKGRTPQ